MIDAGKVEIKPPAKEGKAWTVTQADAVAVDPATVMVSGRLVFNDFNVAAKLTRWGIDAHTGVLFGLANPIVLPAIALGLAGSAIGGYFMWWKRRPIRGTSWAIGPPRARRFLRTASGPLTAAVAVFESGDARCEPSAALSKRDPSTGRLRDERWCLRCSGGAGLLLLTRKKSDQSCRLAGNLSCDLRSMPTWVGSRHVTRSV
ncbi:PepSY domain-containing protein [Arthrobacter sp. AL08]|uniref:PepSY domain-containing protein n=2 Tax=Micrococcales TaxID=85006 RepID=UPI00249BFB8F|nr:MULTISPECIES: PepSY domain-containing protein [Micrococcaceae]MDI3241013.1 PepSY domain-containing protein [Arthrobacter sp. AL05]MDI3277011.1 PepSY domain-containing protein [Arthrobacter sp. AL08]MDJ0352259.1 PepSY domain-containing protein [Pseudarthrobacter sp. PH31-O2]